MGLSVAFNLVERGETDVTVIERTTVAGGSSGLSAGIIETQYVEPLDIELRARSMEVFNRLERDHGLTIVRNGYLRLARDEVRLPAFRRSIEIQQELGVTDVVVVSQQELTSLVPDLRVDDLAGGLFGPSDGYIDGHEYCTLLAELVLSAGAVVRSGVELLGAEPRSRGGLRLLTSERNLDTDVVVNAAGPWAGKVGRLLAAEVQLIPQRHQAALAHLPRTLDYLMPSIMDYTPHSGEFGLYFRHESADQLLVGLHTEEPLHDVVDPDGFPRSADEDFLEVVAKKLTDRVPSLAGARLAHGWAGLYPVSPDGLPQVGPAPANASIISVCGPGGSGIQMSPVLGRLAAEWILDGSPRSFSAPGRLAPGRATLPGVSDAPERAPDA